MFLYELDKFIGNYQNIVNASNFVFPLLLTIFMAMIAYEQYKINSYFEYNRFWKDLNNDIKTTGKDIANKICDILSSDENIDKQDLILKEFERLEELCCQYECVLEYADAQLLKEAYADFKVWIKETKNFKWTFKNIVHSYNVITTILSFLWYADICCISRPNKHVTLYSLIGFLIGKIYTFFIPYFIQKRIKKFLYPKIFKIKTLFLCFVLIKKLINVFKDDTKNKYKRDVKDSIIEAEVSKVN